MKELIKRSEAAGRRCSINQMLLNRKIYMKTPVLKALFNKGEGLQAFSFI